MTADTRKDRSNKRRHPRNFREWREFWWLWVTNASFRNAPDKRRAFYEHLLARHYERRFR
jgi:hypothetical protein